MAEHEIDRRAARRFLLGEQGLWPARRWSGIAGTVTAIHQIGAVQIDPLNVVGRSHDLTLWSRVQGYRPDFLETLLYEQRRFFDYGNLLKLYPMAELPMWRLHMRRRAAEAYHRHLATEHGDAVAQVRREIGARGPLANRDFAGTIKVSSYRARKDSGLALYHLWTVGELMTHHRIRFERVYGTRAEVAPAQFDHDLDDATAERLHALAALRTLTLGTETAWAREWSYRIHRRVLRAEASAMLARLVAAGDAARVRVEGDRAGYVLLGEAAPRLAQVVADAVPTAWTPLHPDAPPEINLLAPLDAVMQRDRARALFGFTYLWEVYKPAPQRRWGYYVLPIMYGDALVGRLEPTQDRATGTLRVRAMWLEDDELADDAMFGEAVARGLVRLARSLGLERLDADGVPFPPIALAIRTADVSPPAGARYDAGIRPIGAN